MWLGSVMLKKLLSQPTSRHSNLRVMDLYIFMQTYLRTLPLLESLGKQLEMKKILSLPSMSFRNFLASLLFRLFRDNVYFFFSSLFFADLSVSWFVGSSVSFFLGLSVSLFVSLSVCAVCLFVNCQFPD